MLQMNFCNDNEHDDENNVENIAIRCSTSENETGLSMKNMNTNYTDIITSFVLHTVLHHVVMSYIIDTHEQLKYDMDKHNPNWITGGLWYNTSICKKCIGNCLKNLLEIPELTYIISYILLMHIK